MPPINYTRIYRCVSWIEKCVFYAFIFLIPLQTRRIFYFWGDEFNEWTAISLYVTDILALGLFIFWTSRNVKKICRTSDVLHHIDWASVLLLIFVCWSGIGVFFAANFYLGVYHWIKLAEMVFLVFYVRQFLTLNKKNGLARIAWIWVFSAFTQSIIAIAQFFKQGDLGLRIFHESPIGALMDGVAKIDYGGLKFIRAYGLFPHPNLLAAFLGVAVLGCYWLWLNSERKEKFKSYFLWFMLAVIFTGLFLTFSRSAIALVVVLNFVFSLSVYFLGAESNQKKEIGKLILFIVLCLAFLFLALQPLLISRFNIDIGEQAVNLRFSYNKVALDFIKTHPLFGVGIGNFVSTFQVSGFKFQAISSWQYQPVHNLYLLIAAETGILGLILFLVFVGLLLKNIFLIGYAKIFNGKTPVFYFLLFISYFLLLGLIDHYFWTLQQGMLMMWVIFGLSASIIQNRQ